MIFSYKIWFSQKGSHKIKKIIKKIQNTHNSQRHEKSKICKNY